MPRVLITAFEPYEEWSENSSWLTLIELTRWFDAGDDLVTRRYPVDFQAVKHRLAIDMQQDFDLILHLGQAPGASVMRLEGFAVNMGSNHCPLADDGPAAYKSQLPLTAWTDKLHGRGIPAQVSYHAGTYLCNATLYMSQYYAAREALRTQSTFLHLPVSPHQVAARQKPMPSMSVPLMAAGVAMLLEDFLQRK
ncbi:pyroglutamyl-peptidase I [Rosistilla carotiformis]|nr:pyroglutamyl-peptidase I [Rosistilla carotiformis]